MRTKKKKTSYTIKLTGTCRYLDFVCLQMAADVREEEDSVSTMQETQDDISSIYSDDFEPSYMIVQKQMRDLILSQNAAVEGLVQSNVSISY